VDAAKAEELQVVARDPSLRGKTRKEMDLEPFRQTEIRSAVMGVPITITEEVIAKACRVAPTDRFLWNVSRYHPLLDSFKFVVLKGNSATKLVDIDGHHRMLLKFMTECFFQKGGGSDQPSVDHKLVLYFLVAYDKINLPKYLMHHLCWTVTRLYATQLLGRTDQPALIPIVTPRFPNNVNNTNNQSFQRKTGYHTTFKL